MNTVRADTFLMALWLLFISVTATHSQTWMEDTFEDFADGELDASGQNIYVHRDGSLRTIHRFDLNQDSHIDLLFNSTHDAYAFIPATLASVTGDRQIQLAKLAVEGSQQVEIADLNRDGHRDVVFLPNSSGLQHPRRFLTIIWGGEDGWPAHRATGALPMNRASALALVDLNGDDWTDIAVLGDEAWTREQPEGKIVRVFWGGERGFVLTRRQDIGVAGALDITGADLDGDGSADLAVLTSGRGVEIVWATESQSETVEFERQQLQVPGEQALCLTGADATGDGNTDLVVGTDSGVVRIIPGQSGRSFGQVTESEGFDAAHIAVGDLDRDGHRDLVLTGFEISRADGGEAGAADEADTGVHILWGGPAGFDASRSTAIGIPHASATAIGDLDSDGQPDLAIAVYQGENVTRSESVILFGEGNRDWGGEKKTVRTEGAIHVAIAPATRTRPARAVFCNSLGGSLREQVPLLLYWGGPQGFSPERLWKISVNSGYEGSAADLNADGFVDLIAINSGHVGEAAERDPTLGANIFWGRPAAAGKAHGFDEERRTVLREHSLGASNVADLDRDGHLDVVLGAFDNNHGHPEVLAIHYGSDGGFDLNRRVALPCDRRSTGCAVADFNRDSWLDIASTCYKTDKIRIFWGSAKGFDVARKFVLDIPGPIGLETADLNADGFLDIIAGSYFDPKERHHDTGTFLFWGSARGFEPSNLQWLPGLTPIGFTVADFDADGFLDLFSPHYHAELTRESLPCYLYWGGTSGFHTRNRTTLICDSAHDSLAADFDRDGRLDLAVACHTRDGSHYTTSRIFHNDGQRFANPRTVHLPTHGTHWMYIQDMGHIYHRRWEQSYESSIFVWDGKATRGALKSEAQRPPGTALLFEVRAASQRDDLSQKKWQAVKEGSFQLEATDRALQYRALFKSDNGDRFPILDRVTVQLRP